MIGHESLSGIDSLAFIFEQPNAPDPQGVPIPTATWVNCNKATTLGHTYDYRPNLVSIAEIEARTDLQFFVGRPDRSALLTARAAQLWPIEQRHWDPGSAICARQRGHP